MGKSRSTAHASLGSCWELCASPWGVRLFLACQAAPAPPRLPLVPLAAPGPWLSLVTLAAPGPPGCPCPLAAPASPRLSLPHPGCPCLTPAVPGPPGCPWLPPPTPPGYPDYGVGWSGADRELGVRPVGSQEDGGDLGLALSLILPGWSGVSLRELWLLASCPDWAAVFWNCTEMELNIYLLD